MSAQGNKRIGVAMVSPATAKSDNYVSGRSYGACAVEERLKAGW